MRRAIALLRAAGAERGGETASGLARAAGLPWATTVRLIRTLEAERFLARLPGLDRYVLGADLISLGHAGDPGRELAALATPTLQRLVDELNETANLTVVGPDGGLQVAAQIAAPRLVRATDWGRPYPLHASSIGKLLLASFDEPRLARFLAGELPHYASGTVSDPEALRAELDGVRAAGSSTAVDELEDGLAALSVGVYGRRGELVAIVTVSGPSSRFHARARETALPQLRAAADTVGVLARALS